MEPTQITMTFPDYNSKVLFIVNLEAHAKKMDYLAGCEEVNHMVRFQADVQARLLRNLATALR